MPGKALLYAALGSIGILVAIAVGLSVPAYLLAVLFAEGAIVVFSHLAPHHIYGVYIGVALALGAAFFGLDNAGLIASAALVGRL
jgi:hypothetical protein